MAFNLIFKNCLSATNVSFIRKIASASTFNGMWQLLCDQNKKTIQKRKDEFREILISFKGKVIWFYF